MNLCSGVSILGSKSFLVHSFDLICSAIVQYELLDEMMDFGYPQFTEAKILSEFIKTNAYRMEVSQKPPMAVTNAVSWRSEGINYKKNEVGLYFILIFLKKFKSELSFFNNSENNGLVSV